MQHGIKQHPNQQPKTRHAPDKIQVSKPAVGVVFVTISCWHEGQTNRCECDPRDEVTLTTTAWVPGGTLPAMTGTTEVPTPATLKPGTELTDGYMGPEAPAKAGLTGGGSVE